MPATARGTPIGVIVHARTAEFLAIRVVTDPERLRQRFPSVDHELLARYLHTYERICAGDPAAGPVALEPPSDRPDYALERLYQTYVTD